jgi:hypothetical protein
MKIATRCRGNLGLSVVASSRAGVVEDVALEAMLDRSCGCRYIGDLAFGVLECGEVGVVGEIELRIVDEIEPCIVGEIEAGVDVNEISVRAIAGET